MAGKDEFQHYERFDMDNDYEGGQWVNGEFYYSTKRQKRMQTKEEQLYGVFAEDSDDSEGDRRGRRKDRDRNKDYTKPVGFVSSGKIVQDTTRDDEEEGGAGAERPAFGPAQRPGSVGPSEDGEGDGEEEGDGRPSFARGGLGLGAGAAGGAGGGLGFKPSRASEDTGGGGLGFQPGGASGSGGGGGGLGFRPGGSTGGQEAKQEEHEEEEAPVLPSAFGKRILERAQARLAAEQREARTAAQQAAVRSTTLSADPTFATFEKHTKGIGLRLLEKMGYKPGEGLGRHKQGIARPVEARMRPKGMALGFGEREEPKMELPRPPGAPGLGAGAGLGAGQADGAGARDQEAKAAAPGAKGAWKKKAKDARVRREYRTADQVLAEAAERPAAQAPTAILDMRGPQARLVTNMAHLNEEAAAPAGDKTPMPELQHNLRLLVDLAEAAITRLDAKLRHEQDTATLLARERSRLAEEDARQAAAAARLAAALSELDVVRRLPAAAPLEELASGYGALREAYREEYVMYGLGAAALAQALPRWQAFLRGWNPLAEPTRGVAQMRVWRGLLAGEGAPGAGGGGDDDGPGPMLQGGGGGGPDDPYGQLVWEAVLPPLRSATLAGWQPREPEPLLAWLEAWEPLLPPAALSHVYEMLVLPKLRQAVAEWEPRRETVPIHAWLFPWLPYLGQALDELYPPIRHKLDAALAAWHPSDGSALVLLAPWQRVWEAKDWEAFVAKAILPKLALALGSMDINPACQQLEPWAWAMAWQDAIPAHLLATLLERAFFPRWHAVLGAWLSQPGGAALEEVTRWYLGWKAAVPRGVLDCERVRAQFNAALAAMNAVLEDGTLPPQPPVPPPLPHDYSTTAAAAAAAAASASARDLSLRDLVVRFAAERGLIFQPKPGRSHEGLQVYGFGHVGVVLDAASGVVRAQLGGRWAAVSLEQLAALAAAGPGAAGGKKGG